MDVRACLDFSATYTVEETPQQGCINEELNRTSFFSFLFLVEEILYIPGGGFMGSVIRCVPSSVGMRERAACLDMVCLTGSIEVWSV